MYIFLGIKKDKIEKEYREGLTHIIFVCGRNNFIETFIIPLDTFITLVKNTPLRKGDWLVNIPSEKNLIKATGNEMDSTKFNNNFELLGISRKISEEIKSKLGYASSTTEFQSTTQQPKREIPYPEPEEKEITHKKLEEILVKLGEIEGKHPERKYRHEGFEYDVIWRRIERGNPTHVFEIQLKGNLYEALTRLKHAYDIWNSNPFLVLTEEDEEKAKRILAGSFHEISKKLTIIKVEELLEFYDFKEHFKELEKRLEG